MEKIVLEKLIEAAKAAREKAYVPYSKFKVGAALLTGGGQIYTGCNVENVSFGLTICAERTAVVKAVSEGQHDFTAIAVVADTEEYCSPCGACRQVLAEFGPEIEVYLVNRRGEYRMLTTAELLPSAFDKIEVTGTEKQIIG